MSNKPDSSNDQPAAVLDVPELPAASGAWFGTRTQIIEKDTTFVSAHADYLNARAAQADALHALVSARMRVARLMVELAALPELCRRTQEHRLRMQALQNEAEATEVAIILADARNRLRLMSGGTTKPNGSDGSLSVDDVESVLAQFPEMDGSLSKISVLLRALVREKAE